VNRVVDVEDYQRKHSHSVRQPQHTQISSNSSTIAADNKTV